MKKIVLIDASPRKGGNSEAVTDIIANDLAGCEVTVFKIHEKDCRPCRACGFCQGKNTQQCVQKDDITALLPVTEQFKALVFDGIPERGQIREHADYLEQVHRLAGWFAE